MPPKHQGRSQARPTPARRKVAITKRDVALMELLVERRAETLDELAGRFFAQRTRKRALNRLGQLTTAGYLQRTHVVLPGDEATHNVYTLGPRGKTALALRSAAAVEMFAGRRFNPTLRAPSLPHQIVTNRVADRLGVRMTHEHLLCGVSARGGSRPDGVYAADRQDRPRPHVWVEVDLGHYSRRRIHDKVLAAMEADDVRGIILVCMTERRAEQVYDWLDRYPFYDASITIEVLAFDEVSLERLDPSLRPVAGPNGDLPSEFAS